MRTGARVTAKHGSDLFKHFRLSVAREILCNLQNILYGNGDIPDAYYVAELFDEYALRLLIEWLATKYGFDQYAPYMEPVGKSCTNFLFALLQDHDHYPFLNTRPGTVSAATRQRLFSLLDQSFSPYTELIGALYEQIVNRPLLVGEDGAFDLAPDIQALDKRRLVGQFYTPPHIVRHCFDELLGTDSKYFMSKWQELVAAASGAGSGGGGRGRIEEFRLLDPACGTGNFLIGAVKLLSEYANDASSLLQFVCRSLHGIELDGKALAMARIAVLLEAMRANVQLRQPQFCCQMFDSIRQNLIVGDSVIGAAAASLSPHHQLASFDLVITNPPYVSYGSRNQPELTPSQAALLRSCYPEGAEYKIRLHSIFQDIALRFCRDGGHAVLFVPDGFLTGSFYAKLRRLLLDKSAIVSLSELPDDTMPGAVVGRWCVAQYRKRIAESEMALDYDVRLRSSCDAEMKLHVSSIDTIVSANKCKIRLLFSREDEQIFRQMSQLPPLGSCLRGHTGLRSTRGQKSIIAGQCQGELWRKGIKSGSQISPYCLEWDGTWLHVDPTYLFKGGFDPQVIDNEKVLVRQTGDRLTAAVDQAGLYHLNNVHSFSGQRVARAARHLDPHFVVALMNCSFWLYLYQMSTRERARALAQIDIETVEAMPLPLSTPDNLRRSDLIGALSKQCSSVSETKKRIIWQRAIDRLVYDLYGLSAQLVDHVEGYCQMADARRSPVHVALPTFSEIECFV
ncbi:MAG TPA: DNA methyltransferase [Trichormus sp.]